MEKQVAEERSFVQQQNALQERLRKFVNGGFASRGLGLAAMAGVRGAWSLEALSVSKDFRNLRRMTPDGTISSERIRLKTYRGGCKAAVELGRFVENHLSDATALALVHGSVATGEEVAYSDIDALIVLKDEVVASPVRLAKAGRHLNRARRIMYEFDPLQHHGWFVLTESDLRCLCDAHFSPAILRHSALVYPSAPLVVDVSTRESTKESYSAFLHLARNLERRLKSGRYPLNLYELKVVLSQFMLLPAMYLQVRDGEGVWKGYSFELARHDFRDTSWEAMDTASDIRWRWPDVHEWRRPEWPEAISNRMTRRTAPPIPVSLSRQLNGRFYRGAVALIQEMRENANELCIRDRHGSVRDEISC